MSRKQFLLDGILHLMIVTVIVLVDQFVKIWAKNTLVRKPIILWKNVFSFQLVYNTGGPWGMFGNHTFFLTMASVVILLFVVAIYLKMPRIKRMVPLRICILLITAGAIGNMIDRIVYKKVIDMFSFDLIHFPVFNVADASIVCGCILAFLLVVFYYRDEDFQWKN